MERMSQMDPTVDPFDGLLDGMETTESPVKPIQWGENDELERRRLAGMSTTKRSGEENKRLEELNLRKLKSATDAIDPMLMGRLSSLDIEGKFDYTERETRANNHAQVPFITQMKETNPAVADNAYRQLAPLLVEVGSLAREAHKRAAEFRDAAEEIRAVWASLSPEDVQWRVEAEVAPMISAIVTEGNRAKRHAAYIQSCYDQLTGAKFLVDALISTWEKMKLTSPSLTGGKYA